MLSGPGTLNEQNQYTNKVPEDPAPEPPDKITQQIGLLEFPGNDSSLLFPFFNKLKNAGDIPGGIRIVYYGDSQIEGDRITSFLRERLQEKFGGSGPGLIAPTMVVPYTQSVHVSGSSNWRRYTLKDLNEGIINHNRLGLLMAYSSFTAPYEKEWKNVQKATIRIGASDMGYYHSEKYNRCRILLDAVEGPVTIGIKTPEGQWSERILSDPGLKIPDFFLDSYTSELELTFRARKSPHILGIALDDTSGIAIDNIPMRGSRGTDFSRSDTSLLRELFRKMKVEMLILHFGPNVATNVRGKYQQYEHALIRELKLLKHLGNDLPVLVIGISDMVVPAGPGSETLPDLGKIRDAQKNAAFKAGCVFWDLYSTMGGEGSIATWTERDPPLARKDRIHFSYEGAEFVAEQLYQAIMKSFALFEMNH